MNSSRIGVEIFHDAVASTDSTAAALGGMAIVNEITSDAFTPVRTDRRIRAGRENQLIVPMSVNWPKFDAPMSIMLTERQIGPLDNHIVTRGLALAHNNLAIVNTKLTKPEITTAHELGHLLHAKYPDESNNHCPDNTCIMHAFAQPEKLVSQRVRKKGIAGWLERNGFIEAKYIDRPEPSVKFCDPCKEQLAQRAFFMIKHLQGENIPQVLR